MRVEKKESLKDTAELKEFDYLLVPLENVELIIRNHGMSSDGRDEILIEQDAPIIFKKKGQKL